MISLSGSLDTETHEILDNKVESLINDGAARIITLDMKELNYISSMGVRSIFKAKKSLSNHNGSLMMVNLQPQVKKVFDIIDALPSMKVFTSMQEMDNYLSKMQSDSV